MPHYNVNPCDSSIISYGFKLGAHHEKAWKEEAKRVHGLRGDVLATVFEVEATIDYTIGDLLLPFRRSVRSPSWLKHRHILLQNEVLVHFDLRTKIEILCSLMTIRFPKQKNLVRTVSSKLDSIRDVRNKMAHCPVFFEALKKMSKQSWLKAYLMTTRGKVHLSEGYIRAFKRDASESISLIHKIMRSGLKVRPPVIR
jgi:hypothetical protein